ncbi:P-loop containing nucleoside triphosphate hydrolase protein [Mycena floridula]|nr:P-loop containing nucleoside triphosphate hydrolase protein [Mycena floridula]
MTSAVRAAKLSKHFNNVLQGKEKPGSGLLFLEAIYSSFEDPATTAQQLFVSVHGLPALQTSMRADTSPDFLNGPGANLIRYFSAPGLAQVNGGDLLVQILKAILEPPFFWNSLDNAQYALAWLFLQAVGLPDDQAILQVDIARPDEILDTLLSSKQTETKAIAQKIQQLIKNGTLLDPATEDSAGGRHSNDFLDFREIAILPTGDELASQRKAFLRPSSYLDNQQTESNRMLLHLDNQYRLLREDMIYEMRDELDIVFHRKKGKQRGFHIDSMILQDLHTVSRDRSGRSKNCRWGLTFQCPNLKLFDGKLPNHKPGNTAIKPEDRRKAYLQDNKHVLKHQSMACLVIDDHIVAFATINRDEDLLIQEPSVIVLELEDDASTPDALLRLARAKEKRFLSLTSELLLWKEDDPATAPPDCPVVLVQAIKADPRQNLKGLIGTPKDIVLDQAQAQSLIAGLSQRVSLIQGPPGTGKSFIGALLAKVLHDRTNQTILVVCYTNHALDQFLEDLLDIGIPETSLVRLGGNAKATDRTARFSIQNLTRASGFRRNKGAWEVIDRYKTTSTTLSDALDPLFNQRLGREEKAVQEDYLLQRWISGQHPGVFSSAPNVPEAPEIWSMPLPERRERYANWQKTIMAEVVELFAKTAKSYNKSIADTDRAFNDNEAAILSEKRIIGCTTTAAAKYRANLKAVNPGVLLVEEAGEILESHLLTACGDGTQQLILIGDHQQLRPKINNYELSVEKGEGFDLNRSLFERLVLKGYPHKTLVAQHRMRPEISTFVRALTYPDLIDAPKTQGRPDLRGVTDNVVFIQHDKPEDEDNELQERKDITAKSSKQNRYVAMVLKTVRYLAQQGYGTDDMVVLTPYLGQLRALREALKSFDPVLSDLDSHELIKAGLLSPTTAKLVKKPLRLATIDNYQGEEAKIVIASLTRSNSTNDIGFMSSPERLNVLLSRARDSLILIGNLQTFQTARKGGEVWKKLLELLQKKRHVYDGLPTRCERHPDKRFLLKCPEDFDKFCPEGGCLEPCGVMLQCGVHSCPSKCHNLVDHSKMICDKIITAKCPEGHPLQWKCQKPSVCQKCAQEQKIREKKQQAEFEQQERRDKDAREHAEWIARIDSEIAQERELMKDAALAEERANAIKLKEKDLEDAKAQRAAKWSLFSAFPKFGLQQASQEPQASPDPSFPKVPNPPSDQPTAANANPQPSTSTQQPARSPKASKANDIWQHLKNVQGAQSDAIDKIMAMTGLEEVKLQVLNIKHKVIPPESPVDIAIRQNVSLKDERFSVLMLGNPGTGKTTIARLYGQFLAEMKIIPGQDFIETTGSRLANDGVPGAIKKLEQLSKADGGVFFIDEAYQLADDHEGKKVLEYLLAEIEALLGKVVFIFAGYDKEMEKLFENPGFFSRVPYTLKFADYKDNDLHDMLANSIQKQFGGRMKVDDPDGIYGLYGRILIRRLGRGRGTKGFGNARALANVFAKVLERQAERVANDRRTGKLPDDLLLMKEDLIGPAPENVFPNSEAWKKLQAMIGLAEIKKAVQNLFHMAQTNYDRELLELKPNQVSLNRVFIGSPGTGKTTVAKYYGQILAELGLLSNGEVIVKNPADFIGNVLGASESQTKAILNSTVGKAYMLYGGSKAGGSDSFKTAVIDTIVAEVQSGPSEDRCVLLVGYKEQMEEMFQNVNPGLSRRFAIDNAYEFKDYSDSELLQALEFKLKEHDLTCTDAAKQVAMDVLNRARNRPNFGNIGEVENLLNKAKLRYQERQASLPYEQRSPNAPFEPSDFDVDFNRGENAASNLAKLFEDVVGADEIVEKLGKWQQMSKNMKALGKDPRDHVPTTFVFKGPPGTGKTTTARKMGQVFRDMGFLSSAEVVECSASDLVGQYVGQTGPKTKQQFEKALGRVLFIDEAYRLADGHFAQEAMDELVGILTQERFRGKLIVILAGYDQDMNRLMAVNSGLSSRFPEELVFRNIEPEQCLTILKAKLLKNGVTIDALDDLSSSDRVRILELIQELSILPSWGNARDIETLAKKMLEVVYTSKDATSSLKLADAVTCVEAMLTSRRERATNVSTRAHHQPQLPVAPPRTANPPPRPIVSTNSTVAAAQKPKPKPTPTASSDAQRDPGVSDEVWAQLQRDKQAMLDEQKRLETAKADAERSFRQAVDEAKRKEKEAKAQSDALAKAQKEKALAADILRRRQNEIARQRELARLAELKVKAEKEKREAAKRELEQQRRQEAAVQTKLRSMGVCVAGFRWIKQHGGYRCAGGTHFISDAQLGV